MLGLCNTEQIRVHDLILKKLFCVLYGRLTRVLPNLASCSSKHTHTHTHTHRWLDELKEPVSESGLRFPSPTDLLTSTSPRRSVSCVLRQSMSAVWDQMKMIIISEWINSLSLSLSLLLPLLSTPMHYTASMSGCGILILWMSNPILPYQYKQCALEVWSVCTFLGG